MRLLKIAAAMCLLAVAACGPSACSTTSGAPVITQTLDEKALYTVELAYAGGLAALETAVDAGTLSGDDASRAVTILDQANTAVVLARRAYAAGDKLQTVGAIQQAYEALGQLRGIVPPS